MARVSTLVVALYGRRIGVIERNAAALSFAYDEDYVVSGRGPTPLSLSMPLSAHTRYRNAVVQAHLRGLLPDHADVRARWAAHFGIDEKDTFGLIRAIGADCAGAAMYVEEHQLEQALAGVGDLEPYGERQIADRLRRLREDDTDWLGDDDDHAHHWSLAGGQGKFTLARTGDGWARPTGFAPSTHIVKPGITRIPAQALTEHICQSACATAGLPAAASRYLEFEDQPAIVVERFDRRVGTDRIVRVHQEDMCQAMGLDPSRKYAENGGPGVARIAQLLRAVDEPSARAFARAVVANYLVGAPDAHAKNFSILLVRGSARLAPLYDVASGLAVSRKDGVPAFRKAAMGIGGENRFGEVEAEHWVKFARDCGLPVDEVRLMVRELAERMPDAVADAISTVPSSAHGHDIVRRVLQPRVTRLCALTLAGLDASRRVDGRVVAPAIKDLAFPLATAGAATVLRELPGSPGLGGEADVFLRPDG